MSTLSQFFTPGLGGTITVDEFRVDDIIFCGAYVSVRDNPLGTRSEGGFIICRSSSNAWIVAPQCTDVRRTWYCRDDASTVALLTTGCTGWFVPTCGQLVNPGYTCSNYWDVYCPACYWSSTAVNINNAWTYAFGGPFGGGYEMSTAKTNIRRVRAFRCVTY